MAFKGCGQVLHSSSNSIELIRQLIPIVQGSSDLWKSIRACIMLFEEFVKSSNVHIQRLVGSTSHRDKVWMIHTIILWHVTNAIDWDKIMTRPIKRVYNYMRIRSSDPK